MRRRDLPNDEAGAGFHLVIDLGEIHADDPQPDHQDRSDHDQKQDDRGEPRQGLPGPQQPRGSDGEPDRQKGEQPPDQSHQLHRQAAEDHDRFDRQPRQPGERPFARADLARRDVECDGLLTEPHPGHQPPENRVRSGSFFMQSTTDRSSSLKSAALPISMPASREKNPK